MRNTARRLASRLPKHSSCAVHLSSSACQVGLLQRPYWWGPDGTPATRYWLASVIGGLVRRPVIAVPTSAGYGANFEGLATLLAMLNSCASGVTTVNIDNGFGAGYSAALIARGD